MKFKRLSASLPQLMRGVFLILFYFGSARFGLSIVAINGVATPIWAPTGISLAILFIYGPRLWPGVALAAFAANLSVGTPPLVCLGISLGNTLEALVGYFLLHRLVKFHNSIERIRDVLSLIFLAAMLSTLVSATLGTVSSWLGGVVGSKDFGTTWWTWWLGDMMGDLIVAPVILTWSTQITKKRDIKKIIEAGFLLFALILTSRIIFGNQWSLPYNLPYMLFPLMIWVALRFGQRGTTLFSLLISGLAIWYTINGLGPFIGQNLNESLLSLQNFLGIVSITSMFLAATMTQRKRAEELSAKLAAIVNSSEDAIIGKTLEGIITSWNLGAQRIYGYTADEVVGKSISILVPPNLKDEMPMMLEKIRQGTPIEHYETKRLKKNGELMDVSLTISVVKDSLAQVVGASASTRDITKQKQSEKALRESEERTRAIIEHALDAIVVMDSQGLITSWNPQAEKIFGWSATEVMGKRMSETIIPFKYREAHEKGFKHFLATGEGPFLDKRIEFPALHREGYEFPVELTISAARMSENFIFSAFIRDITEQKSFEQVLLKQKQELMRSNQELEHFAYASSHDLQEPLHTINGFVNRLKTLMAGRLDETESDYLERIHRAILRMSRLIGDLLTYSRVTTKGRHFESVDLQKVIRDVLSDLEARLVESGAKIEVGPLPIVEGDRVQIRQLFQNLIGNAVKFHKKNQSPHAILQSRDMQNGFVEVTVEDEGIGFEEKFANRIFEPFQRLHGWSEYEGSGIGLAICKKIVMRHGGHMEAKGELDKGASFIFTLPLKK